MSNITYPAALTARAPLGLQQAAERLWELRYLLKYHALDPHAAMTSLALLAKHPHPAIRALVSATECDVCDRAIERSGVLAR